MVVWAGFCSLWQVVRVGPNVHPDLARYSLEAQANRRMKSAGATHFSALAVSLVCFVDTREASGVPRCRLGSSGCLCCRGASHIGVGWHCWVVPRFLVGTLFQLASVSTQPRALHGRPWCAACPRMNSADGKKRVGMFSCGVDAGGRHSCLYSGPDISSYVSSKAMSRRLSRARFSLGLLVLWLSNASCAVRDLSE